jgi:hypothetical protein
MRLHGWWHILNLYHRDCAGERGKVSLESSQHPLSLLDWNLSYVVVGPPTEAGAALVRG